MFTRERCFQSMHSELWITYESFYFVGIIMNGKMLETENGDKAWILDTELHRIDGPSIEWANGYRTWYVAGKWIGCGTVPPSGFYNAVVAYKKSLSSDELTVDDLGDLL